MAATYLVLCICLLGAVTGLRDELLWAKQQWPELTLEFPWQAFKEQADRIQRGEETSLDGPDMDLPKRVAEAEARGSKLHPDLLEVVPADTARPHAKAVAALSCHECQALSARLWEDMVAWVNAHGEVPTRAAIVQYARDMCQYEIPVSVLKSWMLLRVDVRRTYVTKPPQTEGGAAVEPQFYMGPRAGERAVPEREQALARQVCRELLSDADPNDDAEEESTGSLINAVADHLTDYAAAVAKLRTQAGLRENSPSRSPRDGAPSFDQSCLDKHPLCESWATRGECAANPNYMVGKGSGTGHCRRACGRCTVPAAPAPSFLAAAPGLVAAAAVEEKARREAIPLDACPTCTAGSGGEDDALAGLLAAADQRGTTGSVSAVPPSVLEQTSVMLVRPMADPLLPLARGDLPPPATALRTPGPGALPAEWALHDAIGGKCLYVSTGWWLYEVCPGWRVLQFHLSPGHAAESVSSLGGAGSAAHWRQAWAPTPLLHPGTDRVPALAMDFQDGTPCPPPEHADRVSGAVDEDDDGKPDSHTPPRESTLLAMCSPDATTRVAVRELQRCVYTIELYVPALCSSLPVQGSREQGDASAIGDDAAALDPGQAVLDQEELELGTIQVEEAGLEELLENEDAVVVIDEL